MGYSKYDYKNKDTNNSHNGYSQKTILSTLSELEINVLRDRKGEYASQLVKKHQTDVSGIEDKVIFLYPPEIRTLIYTSNATENSTVSCAR